MASRAQTAAEYLLLVGAVIFLVVLVYIAVKQNVVDAAARAIDQASSQLAGVIGNFSR